MQRDVAINDIWDGRFYGKNDMAKTGCNGCEGCSDCCRNTGDSIILDPLDMYCLTIWTHKSFEDMIEKEIEIRMTDGMILPNIMEYDAAHPEKPEGCPFLDENGRCSIYAFRPGFCRLFPLGRYYVDEAVGNTQEEISHDAGAEKASCNTEAEKKTCAAEAEKMSGDAETEKMSGDAAEGKLSGEPSENAQFCGKITHGRKRGFYYFLQKGECTKADAERYEVKVSDWIGVEDMDPYEKFICTWHFFLKDTAAQLARFPEKAREQIARSVLQIFYVQPYDRFQDFYPQFEARLASTEKQLAKIGFRYDADW